MFDLLEIVAEKLAAAGIPYMLSGSVAMSFYSVSRSTRDIDIVAYLNLQDAERLLSFFEGYYFHRPSIEEEIRRNGFFNIINQENGLKIDFIVLKSDEYSRIAFGRRKQMIYGEQAVSIISIEDLILAKLKWIQDLYSERQFDDINNLLRSGPVDLNYIFFWKDKLRLKTFNLFDK